MSVFVPALAPEAVNAPPSLSLAQEAARLRVLAAYRILDTPPEAAFDRLTALASRALDAPISQVSLVAEKRQWFKSSHGLDARETPREYSICAHALASDEVFIVPNAAADPRFADNPLVTGPPGIRFYAGAPLLAPAFPSVDSNATAGAPPVRLGTLSVIDTRPRANFSEEEARTLRDMAALTVEALLRRLADEHHREEIAGRERAEAAWRRSEGRYRRIAANALGMVFELVLRTDASAHFPLVGEGCWEVFGLSPRDVQREPRALLRCVAPADRHGLRTTIAESARTLQSWHWAGRVRAMGGGLKWVECAARPERLPDGATLWDGMVTDITARREAQRNLHAAKDDDDSPAEPPGGAPRAASLSAMNQTLQAEMAERRRAEEALDESRELAQAIVENATDVIFVKDLAGRYLLINPAGARAIGRPVEEILGRDDRELFSAESAGIIMADERAIMAAGQPRELEDTAVPRDGRPPHIFSSRKVPLRDRHGCITGLVGISRDITALKAGERTLRDRARQQAAVARLGQRALEGGEEGLDALLREAVRTVAETLAADFSTAFEFLPGKDMLVRRAGHGWPAEALHQLDAAVEAGVRSVAGYTLMTGRAVMRADMREEREFELSEYSRRHGAVGVASVVIDRERDGKAPSPAAPFGVLNALFREPRACSEEDMAFLQTVANILATAIARHRAEVAVRQARAEAERANAAKSEFLSRMSHELRTPLNAILGFGQLLELDAQTPRQSESVDYVLRAGRHLLALIDEVLDISRIESGHMPLEIEPVSPLDLMREAASLVRNLAAEHGVTIGPPAAVPAGLAGGMVLADARRLRQVFLNLLSNAVKYNRRGGGVTLTLTRTAGGDGAAAPGTLRFAVRDAGLGIDPKHLGRLFTPFDRLDADRTGVEGTGIGLALTKRLVEAQGGRIGVDSVQGVGSTFWVELPEAREP